MNEDQSKGAVTRLVFENASVDTVVEPEHPLAHPTHILVGRDRSQWRTGLRSWESVLFQDPWSGIDVRVRLADGRPEYDLLLDKNASLVDAVIRVESGGALSIDESGALVISTAAGDIRQPAPTTWIEMADGTTARVACRYRILDATRYGFDVEGWPIDNGQRLVIDPGIEWATFIIGAECDAITDMIADAAGTPIVTGYTGSLDFPTTPGAYDETYSGGFLGCCDALVTKFAPDGQSLEFSTYLGGNTREEAHGICLLEDGSLAIAGCTFSTDFPITPDAVDSALEGIADDAFLTRLSADGSDVLYSTYLGGGLGDEALDVAVAANGDPIVAGTTVSTDFPTTPGAFQDTVENVTFHGFVSRLDGFGNRLVFSTYLTGDKGSISVLGVDTTSDGDVIAAGFSSDENFPTTPGAFSNEPNGPFISRLSADGSELQWSTFLGGSGVDSFGDMVVDSRDRVLVSGATSSRDFPITPRAFQSELIGIVSTNGFVTCFQPRGDDLLFSTYFGFGNVEVTGLAVDAAGVVTLAGAVPGNGIFPTDGAAKTFKSPTEGKDGFVARFEPTGDHLLYCSYFGGPDTDAIINVPIALTDDGRILISMVTDGPVPDADANLVVGRLDPIPTGIERFGTSTPGTFGPLVAGVSRMPQLGETAFAITGSAVTPRTEGVLLLAREKLSTPQTLGGVDVWVDLGAELVVVPSASTETGWIRVDVPLLPARFDVGDVLYAQLVWTDAEGPAGRIASDALAITIQPPQ